MASTRNSQRKRSADGAEFEKVKRQLSARTEIAIKLEESLHLQRENDVPSISPEVQEVQTLEELSFFPEGPKLKKSSPKKAESLEFCLNDDEATCDSHDEADGLGSVMECVKNKMNDLSYDVADGCARVIQSFTDSLLPHHVKHTAQSCEDSAGFSVHLPSQFHNGDPVHFGGHFSQTEKGYRLARVIPETMAHKVGLRQHDILTHLNEVELKRKEVREFLLHFMSVEKTFTLTILREVGHGDDTRLVEMTLKITLTLDVDKIRIEVELIVTSSQITHLGSSEKRYIVQTIDRASSLYLNVLQINETETVTKMGTCSDETGIFQFDIYVPLLNTKGQLCAIRHCKSKKVYGPVEGKLKAIDDVKLSLLVDKQKRDDDSFVFESIEKKGHYLEKNSSGELVFTDFGSMGNVPSSGSFQLFEL